MRENQRRRIKTCAIRLRDNRLLRNTSPILAWKFESLRALRRKCGVNIGTRESTKGFCLCHCGRIGAQRCALAVADGRIVVRSFRSGLGQSRGCVATIRTPPRCTRSQSCQLEVCESADVPSLFELIAKEGERQQCVCCSSRPLSAFRASRLRFYYLRVHKMSQMIRAFLEQRFCSYTEKRIDGFPIATIKEILGEMQINR